LSPWLEPIRSIDGELLRRLVSGQAVGRRVEA
jgi:hypothetical protein